MRVVWCSPWLRSLSRVHVEALRARGHEVLLVTSDQHPESDTARPYELVLTPSPKQPRSWPQFAAARRRVQRFGADVVVTELVRDPRWTTLAPGVPRVDVVHDDRPHDADEARPRWERALFDRRRASAATVVTFSRFVAAYVAAELGRAPEILPLPSDLDPAVADAFGPPAPAAERRDIVLFGRLNPYKNVAVTLAAWDAHRAGPGWRGDELVLLGSDGGGLPRTLPPHVRHEAGAFRYADVVARLRRAKAAVAHYRQASQSGVQVLALQLGVVPVVSPVGGLPEYQPPGETPVDVDDVSGLAARFDALADPDAAARRGVAARRHYAAHWSADVAAARWEQVFSAVRSTAPAPRRRVRSNA